MATLALSSSRNNNGSSSTKRHQPVQILPRQATTPAVSHAPLLSSYPASDFVFPENVFDFEEEFIDVDELLMDLGMDPPPASSSSNYDGMTSSNQHDDYEYHDYDHQAEEQALLPPFLTNTSSDWPPVEASAASERSKAYNHSFGGVVRTVSLDQVSAITGSVPNPMRNIPPDEPPSKKQKIVYNPLLPYPATSAVAAADAAAAAATSIKRTTTSKPHTATRNIITPTKKITPTTTNKVTIAKSSSIPSLLPSSYFSSTTQINKPSTSTIPSTSRAPAMELPQALTISNERKRKMSRKEAELNLSMDELEERRERNRSHAKKSRQRKKAITELLQESVQSLQQANQILRQGLNQEMGEHYAEQVLESQKELEKQSFLEMLKNPANRVVDASGLAFFKKLQKRVPKDNEEDGDCSN
ncbi:unnamed protein product [Cylindrotheca closterium]|uniref:BZIP domain-containing protein n=1 Tax=Cylindrotheca closterium TaxID=2856 RepID=A0AAD2CR69_9STRA|nr:unnamed protein product [Cylindrotheca closterium]